MAGRDEQPHIPELKRLANEMTETRHENTDWLPVRVS